MTDTLSTERKVHDLQVTVSDLPTKYLYVEGALLLGMFLMWAEILGHWN